MATNLTFFFKLVGSLLVSFLLSIFFTKKVIEISNKKKATQIEREYLDNHIAKKGTPTMGGIGFVLSSVISFFLFNFNSSLGYSVLAVLLSYIGFFLIGFVDDYLKIKIKSYAGLSAKIRILLEIVLCMYVVLLLKEGGFTLDRLYLPLLNNFVETAYLFLPFFLIVLIGSANAINLSDGLDGLASGLSMIALTPFLLISLEFLYELGQPMPLMFFVTPFHHLI